MNDDNDTGAVPAPDPGKELDARLIARLDALTPPAVAAERERIRQLAIRTHAVTVSRTGRMQPFEELLRHSPEENAGLLLQVADPARAAPCGCLSDFEHGPQCGPRPAVVSGPPAPPPATPGQRAYEAHAAMLVPRPWRWDQLDGKLRAAWEAAAQAATAAAPPFPLAMACTASDGDTVVIAFREPLSAGKAQELADRWAARVPGVKVIVLDNADEAASYRQDNEQLRDALAKARRELDEARASGIRFMGIIEMYIRSLYAVKIDVIRGDTRAVMEALSESLDGFDGPEWNRMETGAEWLERTREGGGDHA